MLNTQMCVAIRFKVSDFIVSRFWFHSNELQVLIVSESVFEDERFGVCVEYIDVRVRFPALFSRARQ